MIIEGESSDSSCGEMEDEFMPIKTPVNTGPARSVKGGTATRGAKTETHNNVMWSHLIGKNVDETKEIEIINYEVCDSFTYVFCFNRHYLWLGRRFRQHGVIGFADGTRRREIDATAHASRA